MATPNLNITHIAAAQTQKEVTANAAFDGLDKALCDQLAVDFTSGNVTLTDAQFRSAIAFRATNLSVDRTLTVPAIKRLFYVNNVDGLAALTVGRGTTTVDVPIGEGRLFYTDGTSNGLFSAGGGGGDTGPTAYLLAGSQPGKPTAAQRVFHHLAGAGFILPQNLTGSAAKAKAAATAEADFDIKLNGTSKGTIRFAASGTTASFIFSTTTTIADGDEIEIIAPGSQDATLADLTWTLKGTIA
jgi:hypothetical protein